MEQQHCMSFSKSLLNISRSPSDQDFDQIFGDLPNILSPPYQELIDKEFSSYSNYVVNDSLVPLVALNLSKKSLKRNQTRKARRIRKARRSQKSQQLKTSKETIKSLQERNEFLEQENLRLQRNITDLRFHLIDLQNK